MLATAMKDVRKVGSTPTSRCIDALRRRAIKHNDPYLNVVADEMAAVYQKMYNARRALMVIEKAVNLGMRMES